MRHKRHFGPNDADALLEAVGACRRACVAASTVAPIGGPIYRATTRLMEELDLVAKVLTGNRRQECCFGATIDKPEIGSVFF